MILWGHHENSPANNCSRKVVWHVLQKYYFSSPFHSRYVWSLKFTTNDYYFMNTNHSWEVLLWQWLKCLHIRTNREDSCFVGFRTIISLPKSTKPELVSLFSNLQFCLTPFPYRYSPFYSRMLPKSTDHNLFLYPPKSNLSFPHFPYREGGGGGGRLGYMIQLNVGIYKYGTAFGMYLI